MFRRDPARCFRCQRSAFRSFSFPIFSVSKRCLDLTPFLFPRLLGGSISPDRKVPSGKPGPPCKSGQLKKDLGLEVSSARHAARLARLITFAFPARLDFIIGAFMFYLSG